MEKFKSGFVSIIGRPNVGKSTLLNTIIKKKVAIISSKAQTTRNKIQGIYNESNFQIIFMDTPGIHKHKNTLGKYMNKISLNSSKDCDVVCFLAPINEYIGVNDNFILKQLKKLSIPVILVLSKSDLATKKQIEEKIKIWNRLFNFTKTVVISSLTNNNIDNLIITIKLFLKNGPKYFQNDIYTNQPEKFIIAEIIREKILELTKQEIPHSCIIIIDKILDNFKIYKIYASIIVLRPTQKQIIIGKKGSLIKEIGISARKDIEIFLNNHVYLELFVKVEPNWFDNKNILKKIYYNKNIY